MTSQDFQIIADFVKREAGIVLGADKTYLVDSRLGSVAGRFGFADVAALARGLLPGPPGLKLAVIDAMTTNESFFFRDTTPFQHFEQVILPALAVARKTTGRIRIWSAACSTGQEPYSLAMQLLERKSLWQGLQVEIVGTDLSPSALNRAREGRYSQFEVQRGLPIQLLVKYFRQEGTSWIISDEIKRMVRFQEGNLLAPMTGMGLVDVIFCRNVLIYFDVATKTDILDRMAKVLRPDGYLILGAAETMMGVSRRFGPTGQHRGLYQPVTAGEKLSA